MLKSQSQIEHSSQAIKGDLRLEAGKISYLRNFAKILNYILAARFKSEIRHGLDKIQKIKNLGGKVNEKMRKQLQIE